MLGGFRPAGLMKAPPPGVATVANSTSKASGGVAAFGATMAKTPGPAPTPSVGDGQTPCTVYIGRISTEVADDFVKQLLENCGKVSKWNRAADPNTSKLTSFGFCDFEDPQALWRALRFLHEKQLCDKRLLVKCEDRVKASVEKWKASRKDELAKRRAERKKDDPDANVEFTDELLEEELAHESGNVGEDIQKLLAEKNKNFPELKESTAAEEKDDGQGNADAKKDADADKDDTKEDDAEKKERERADREKDKEREEEARKRREEREKRDKEEREARSRSRALRKKREAAVSKHFRPSRREGDRERRVRDRERDIEKEYSYRLREFERNEEKRISNFKRDLSDLVPPPEPSDRERRKFADKDCSFGTRDGDEREWKRHREDRARERQREIEKDKADRNAEQKELDEIKKKQDEEDMKRKNEEDEIRRQQEKEAEEERKRIEEEQRRKIEEEQAAIREQLRKKEEEERRKKEAELKKIHEAAAEKLLAQIQQEMQNLTNVDKIPVGKSYNAGDDDDKVPKMQASGGESRMKDDEMRKLIQQVPTEKNRAFAYEIDWQIVQNENIVEKKLRPWVKKKVTEYLGAEEHGMIEFIMRKVSSRTKPQSILEELEGFLDEEAENFTLKMWRMLIFEVLRVKAR